MDGRDTRERILEAAYACVARWGLSKTSVEDVAKEADLSRSTLYRYFPGGRDELIGAVVGWEHDRFFTRLYEAVRDADLARRGHGARAHLRPPVDRRARGAPAGPHDRARAPPAPADRARTRRTVRLVAAFLTPYLERHPLAPGVVVDEAADFLARMVLSYMAAPGRWDLDDPDQVARLVRAELLGGIVPPDR